MRIIRRSGRRQLNGEAQNRKMPWRKTQPKVRKGVAHTHIYTDTHRQSVKCLKNEALKSLASASQYITHTLCGAP